METLLVIFGVLFAVIYALTALIQTLRRQTSIRRFEVVLISLTVFLPLTALALQALRTRGTAADQRSTLVLAVVFGVFGLILLIVELFRPQRLKQSRGLLSFGSALMLALASLLIPFLIAYFSFVPEAAPPSVASAPQTTAAATTATPDDGETFLIVFSSVINVVAEESDLSNDEVLTALDNGQTVAEIVSANGGNLETVVDQITVIMQDFIRELMQQDRVDRIRGAAGIAGMRFVVEYAVNNDLASLARTDQESDPAGTVQTTPDDETPESFFAFLTTTATPAEVNGEPQGEGESSPEATAFPTVTSPPTAQPSPTRTPRPTATATPTRELFSTRTPSPTPTLPSPCLLLPLYNVNLRELSSQDSALITTIPFETALNAFGRTEDTTWWFVEYEGSSGWVMAEFVNATPSCAALPVRRP